MPNRDLILLETVKTHRARLSSAFVFGALEERRLTNDNVRRLIGSIVLAAVVCAGCVGFSFVSSLLGKQAAAQRVQAAQGPATGEISASDTFDRQTSGGWGTAQRGGRWTMIGPAAAYQVNDGQGRIQLSGSVARGGYLPGVLTDRTDLQLTMSRTSASRAGNVTVSVLGRRISSTQDYRLVTRLQGDGSVALSLLRVAEPSQSSETGTEQLSPTVILFGGQSQDGPPSPISVRLQVIGSAPTTLRAKVWQSSGAEPEAWTLTASDDTNDLQRPGSIGLSAIANGSATGAGLAVNDLIGRVAP